MRRALLPFLSIVFLCGYGECGTDYAPMGPFPTKLLAGEAAPPLEVSRLVSFSTVSIKTTGGPGDLPLTTLRGALEVAADGNGVAVFRDLILPSTGTYNLVIAGYGSEGPAEGATERIEVQAPHLASIDCEAAGNLYTWAASQDPRPTIEAFDALPTTCRLTRGGGDPKGKALGLVTCAGGSQSITCNAGPSACFSTPGTRVAQPGQTLQLSWSGGEIAAGSAAVTVPSSLTVVAPPASHSRARPLVIDFSGGTSAGTVTVTLVQQTAGSTLSLDCDVPATAGRLEIPVSALGRLSAGSSSILVKSRGLSRVYIDGFAIDASAPGPLVGFEGSAPMTLE